MRAELSPVTEGWRQRLRDIGTTELQDHMSGAARGGVAQPLGERGLEFGFALARNEEQMAGRSDEDPERRCRGPGISGNEFGRHA